MDTLFEKKNGLHSCNTTLMYCNKKIENFPELGYCYLTVLVERAGEPYQTILFYTYASSNAGYRYSRFIEGIKTLVPLHSTRIKEDCLIVFECDKKCPCGWTLDQIKRD